MILNVILMVKEDQLEPYQWFALTKLNQLNLNTI